MKQAILILTIICLYACSPGAQPTNTEIRQAKQDPELSAEQIRFIEEWASGNKKQVYLLTIFRDRYFTAKDRSEMKKLMPELNAGEQGNSILEAIAEQEEIVPDTLLFSSNSNIKWVSNDDVTTCRKVDDKFWPCFANRSEIRAFYYLSIPRFSKDGKWCVMNINYVTAEKDKSAGGGQLFMKNKKGRWELVRYLGSWGARG